VFALIIFLQQAVFLPVGTAKTQEHADKAAVDAVEGSVGHTAPTELLVSLMKFAFAVRWHRSQ